jgi:UDP-N-acetylmuramate: L-alanyl-gamma-D-glutamyl-meso-diaminopimelate ligase
MNPDELVASITGGGVPADYIPDVHEIVTRVIASLQGGEVILVMSNGGFGAIHRKLLDALEARSG